MKNAALLIASTLAACTHLGPMPTTTGVSAVPTERPALEAQAGVVPGFYLSQGAANDPKGQAMKQASVLVEPDHYLGIEGLIAGVRGFGDGADTVTEPYLGLRRKVGDDVSFAAVAYGTVTNGENNLATYHSDRLGGELAIDVRALKSQKVEGHFQGSVAATHIDATGRYCADPSTGDGIDCNGDGHDTFTDAKLNATYPAATGSFALVMLPSKTSWFSGARLAVSFATGRMPAINDGRQDGTSVFYSGGLTLTLGIGGR